MKGNYLLLCAFAVILIVQSSAEKAESHKVVKRQSSFPLSRSRQFPPPEELEESEEYATSEDEEEQPPSIRREISGFRRPSQPSEEEYSDDYSYTEAPKTTTTVAPAKTTARSVVSNNRFAGRPRFGAGAASTSSPKPPTTPSPSSTARVRATPAQSQRLDVVANILNKPPPSRAASRSIAVASSSNQDLDAKTDAEKRNNTASTRVRTRGRFRPRTSTTTTTTTTAAPQPEEYYYYYEDEEPKEVPVVTTTTTTTTKRPTLPRRSALNRRPSASKPSARPATFDPESQFRPPPENGAPVEDLVTASTKKFTTTTTEAPGPGGIPAHLKHKYRVRTDNRFIDFLRDPNRPRELKGFDLTDYPFYVRVPEDINFDCDDMKDGYYASVPHRCQLFHYCFAGARYDFLCANYTLYDQTTFTCRFANNVDCESSAMYYYRNDDLWKETTTTQAPTPEPRKKKIVPKDDDDYEEDEYDDDDYEDEEEVERRRRPAKRRRNRRKNRRKSSTVEE